jgi:hypothetical protein
MRVLRELGQTHETGGFNISMLDDPGLQARRTALGVPPSLAGCRLAQIDSYIIEGHVPVDDILKLLRERPAAKGLAVPVMPSGSPGMDALERSKNSTWSFFPRTAAAKSARIDAGNYGRSRRGFIAAVLPLMVESC